MAFIKAPGWAWSTAEAAGRPLEALVLAVAFIKAAPPLPSRAPDMTPPGLDADLFQQAAVSPLAAEFERLLRVRDDAPLRAHRIEALCAHQVHPLHRTPCAPCAAS